ncbi:MAG TPA: zinc-binding alcohol dehydrogenase family protein [Acidobacteriaceae bacterium]|jgi:NADPH2:quinone reductase|nr:zinc-binding alcohol dehydrogenase family protein [Acidobacteriaceae bacterium]
MKAAVVRSFDTPPQYADFADPTAQGEELLVHVTAVGLHPIVKALAAGKHYGSKAEFPFIAGIDGTGTLDNGSRVYFAATRSPYGTMAERTVTTRDRCLVLPDPLEETAVAALMNPAMSSFGALTERIHFERGQSVLIQGATGSAGHLAVQICKRLGAARIVATGRDQQALEELLSLGADAIIPLTQERDALVQAFREQLAANKVEIVLDYLWGAPAEALLSAIAQKGLDSIAPRIQYIQIGSSAGPTITLNAATLRSSGLEMLGSGFGSVSIDRIFASLAAFLQEAAKEPFQMKIQPAPLGDVEKLWNDKTDGRVVFQP